ncbi:MAG: hypothetical protein M1434_04315 [Chloroflexi bacterium]|nr:hypothetical protein [Chloroflexota bacterium]MCL5273957.1 hypothetical protein [Chloroflexota bacterium]
MRSKLTEEDMTWLEGRLSAAMAPVEPRAEFIHNAKQAILNTRCEVDDNPRARLTPALSVAMLGLGLALLIAAIVRRRWL